MVSLPDLPLEVLEAICRPLQLRDRLALTSCCCTLLARPDVAGSAQLWGSLGRRIKLGSTKEPPLAGFLTRHAAGLRTLRVALKQEVGTADLAALLVTLAGSGLVDLKILGHIVEGDLGAAFQPLSRLTALTRLVVFVGMKAVPAHLTALQQLACLGLSNSAGLGDSGGPAAFEGLAHLLALTTLSLSGWNLRSLPPQLPSLTLQVLSLYGNPRLGEGGEAAFEGLRHLPTLRTLNLSACELRAAPRQLAALPALEALELAYNEALGRRNPVSAFHVLCELTGLTRLSVRGCDLRRAPAQLASLTALAKLNISRNPKINYVEEEGNAFLPLERLTALTCLDLSWCSEYWGAVLRAVPPQVAALTGLLELDLSGNEALGGAGEDAFQPLLRLSSLTQLNLEQVGLMSLPPQLSQLRALRVLVVSRNEVLGQRQQGDTGTWHQLSALPALERLEVSDCGLPSPAPPTLLELAQQGVNVLGLPKGTG